MNQTIVALSTLIFLHNGNFIPKTEFKTYPCPREKIFITGLNESNAYAKVGEQLELVEDQQLFNLNTTNNQIDVLSKDNILIKELAIHWINDCKFEEDELIENSKPISNNITSTKFTSIVKNKIDISSKNTSTIKTTNVNSTTVKKEPPLKEISTQAKSTKETTITERIVSSNSTKDLISEKEDTISKKDNAKGNKIISSELIIIVVGIIGILILGGWFLNL